MPVKIKGIMAGVVACGYLRKLPLGSCANSRIFYSRGFGYPSWSQKGRHKYKTLNTCATSKVFSSSQTEFISSRSYCDQRKNDIFKPHKRSFPQLMEFPEIVWPSILKSIKNWIMIHFFIRTYFDRDFNLSEFISGAQQALQVISNRLAEGDVAGLNGLVSEEAMRELKAVVPQMSVLQRSELRVNKNDIYLTFPYQVIKRSKYHFSDLIDKLTRSRFELLVIQQVGIMFDESTDKAEKRWVEITMVFHVLQGLKDLQESRGYSSINLRTLPEYKRKVSICNYRFIKEITQGHESDWTANIISHFKPSDFIE